MLDHTCISSQCRTALIAQEHHGRSTLQSLSFMASYVLILLSLSLFHLGTPATSVANMFGIGRNITDGDTLVSPGGSFTMGFFSPGVSAKRYLGIWFSVSETAVCWVANRDRPLNDTSGVLVLGDTGSLFLMDGGSGQVVWSSYSAAGAASSAVARLLESGNLVVSRDQNSSAVLWQSFDHPSNTLLPGMKTGKNLWTGDEWYLTSWRSANDPSPGPYRRGTETSGLPENVVWHGDVKKYRTGPWNGLWFNGVPEMPSYADMFAYQLTSSPGEITYGYLAKPGAPLSRIMVTEDGAIQRLVWDPSSRSWKTFYRAPRDVCDAYARCGAFGLCDVSAASTSFCGCARGFSPASPSAWRMREASDGCRRNVPLGCADGGTAADGFVVVRSVKLPDTRNVSVDAGIGLEECRARCLANCSCVAYAAADIRGGGGAGSGCIIWTDDLVDVRYMDNGQDLYLRLAMSELEDDARTRIGAGVIAAICVVCAVAAVLVSLGFIICRNMRYKTWRRHARASRSKGVAHMEMEAEKPPNATAVVCIDLATIEKATRNFSKRNVIGEGAFGIVYEGQLPKDHPLGEGLRGGRKIAVKRLKLSSLPNRVLDDFTREVAVMSNSKLRHANLVRLLAYCDQGNERALVYEYMQNKSLDIYIFGKPSSRASLDWPTRLEIIHGIARGVWYLHEGSGENVIHRDLKPSNVLLDRSWKPKIADFGTAKLFHADQTGTQTVVVSPGYASPEYAKDGDMTLKCDVFSFGVVLLELVSGRRNSAQPSLLSHAWKLWEEHRIMDLLDPAVPRPLSDDHGLLSELRRCIHIGLLCVQWSPGDRPAMSAALAMLTSRTSQLDQPRRPILQCGTGRPLLAGEATSGGAVGQDPSTVLTFT